MGGRTQPWRGAGAWMDGRTQLATVRRGGCGGRGGHDRGEGAGTPRGPARRVAAAVSRRAPEWGGAVCRRGEERALAAAGDGATAGRRRGGGQQARRRAEKRKKRA
jgi:hypothetical protein